jgi:hypothetical protein
MFTLVPQGFENSIHKPTKKAVKWIITACRINEHLIPDYIIALWNKSGKIYPNPVTSLLVCQNRSLSSAGAFLPNQVKRVAGVRQGRLRAFPTLGLALLV